MSRKIRVPDPLATPNEHGVVLDRALDFELRLLGEARNESADAVCQCRRPRWGDWPGDLTEPELLDERIPMPTCLTCQKLPPIPWSRMPSSVVALGIRGISRRLGAAVKIQERGSASGEMLARVVTDQVEKIGNGATRPGGDWHRNSFRAIRALAAGVEASGVDRGVAVARAVVAAARTLRAGRVNQDQRERVERMEAKAGPERAGEEPTETPPDPHADPEGAAS